jgi:hypothetical protein
MERDDSHHLRPPDGFTKPSLGPPCELRLCPARDTSHVAHEMGEESRVKGLPKRIDAELVEDVLTTGFFGGRTKIRTLEDDGFLCPTFHRECAWGDRLPGRRELSLHPHPAQTIANLVQLGILEHSICPCPRARCGMVGSSGRWRSCGKSRT